MVFARDDRIKTVPVVPEVPIVPTERRNYADKNF
jgi:hypothetical protein